AFDGSLAAKGRYDLRDATPRFTAVTTVKGMDLTQLLNALAPSAAANIRGRLNLDLDVAGAGKEWEVAQKTLKGQGKVQVIDGALLNFNIADSVLSGTLIQLIPGDIKTKYPEIFTAKDTEFKQLAGSATIANGRAYTNDLVIAAAEFETRPKGWFAFDQTVDFSGPLLFSTRLSQDIIGRAREMKNLANEQGRILIPYTLAGKLPGAKPRPDLGYIARAMQKGFIDQGVERFLRGRSPREGSDPTGGDEGKTGRQQRKRRDTPEDILRGLEGFFRR
ncbi:MAG TPA: AsmA-like C-terminal region-containing protein, partial [Candidatus Eisenbacteria bacterium]|nr:AsmA-like C-terminal region-containing protein [Candidatus Eisenbacteria bacterium]